jgi:NADH:ubiquinone oxidoreductase subunit D
MVKITDEKMETERMVRNFGPQHPSTHGTLRIAMELEGETVMKGTPEIGYLHSGFEKLGEYSDILVVIMIFPQFFKTRVEIPYFRRPLHNSFSFQFHSNTESSMS